MCHKGLRWTAVAVWALAANLALTGVSRADVFTPASVAAGLLQLAAISLVYFLLTLLIELPIVILGLRKTLVAPGRFVRILVGINACTFVPLALLQLSMPGYTTFVLGELAVTVVEALWVWRIVARQSAAAPTGQPPSQSSVMGIVAGANVASAVLGVILGLLGASNLILDALNLIASGLSLGGR
jgi:hypothetical protein